MAVNDAQVATLRAQLAGHLDEHLDLGRGRPARAGTPATRRRPRCWSRPRRGSPGARPRSPRSPPGSARSRSGRPRGPSGSARRSTRTCTGPASSGRDRNPSTISSSSAAITETCDFDGDVTPSAAAGLSTRRVETPSRYDVAATEASAASARRRCSRNDGKYDPCRSFGIASSIVPARCPTPASGTRSASSPGPGTPHHIRGR
jgi:hypothetical protein